MPSDTAAQLASSVSRFDPPAARDTVRVTNLYGTLWKPVAHVDGASALTRHLRFGRLTPYYEKAEDQLPSVAAGEVVDPSALTFSRWTRHDRLTGAKLWVLVMPSGQAVVAFSLDVDGALLDTIDLLEDCYYLDVTVGDVPLERYACQLAERLGVADADEHGLAAERHQIAFCAQLPADDREDVMQRVVYRADLPYREEFSAISYPAELNRRPGSSVAVGPYVSVVCGQQDYVENGAFISAAQAVASAVRLREIRDLAYHDVRLFREAQSASQSVHTRRHTLERMANQLGNLELELSFSVESSADLGLLVPSLRVAGYHDALYQCMGLRDKADVVGRMLQRLEHSIGAEMTAIESMDRRADDDRRMRWAVALGFLSTVALPVTLVLTFFGINAREVDGALSMFDQRYWPMYLVLALVITLGIGLSTGLYLQQRRQARREAQRAAEAMAAVRSLAIIHPRPARADTPQRIQTRSEASVPTLAAGSDRAI